MKLYYIIIVFTYFIFHISFYNLYYNYIKDAPKWKFLAEAEQNETLKPEYRTRFFQKKSPPCRPILKILTIA